MSDWVRACCVWVVSGLVALILVGPADAAKLFFSVNNATSGQLYKESLDFACNSSAHELDISGSYSLSTTNGFTISPIPGSGKKARLSCDESTDKLTLENAVVTLKSGSSTVSNVKITLWRTYTGAENKVDYSVSANGTFYGTPNGAWFSLRGYVQNNSLGDLSDPANPPDCKATMTKCASSSPSTWPFSSANGFKITESITPPSPRVLKATLWLKLVPGTSLQFTKLRVNFGAPAGPCDDAGEPCDETEDPCDKVGSRNPGSDGLVFVQCTQENDVSVQCKDQGKNCPLCMVRNSDGMPADPKSAEIVKDGWIKLRKEGGSP